MKVNIIFPCNYFNKNQVDNDYETEFVQPCKFNFNIIFFDYDEFISNEIFNFYPDIPEKGLCIYRGWMLKSEQYNKLYEFLKSKGLELINSPEQYKYCHEFPYSYPILKSFTPAIITISDIFAINWSIVKQTFDRFMVKDFVKSVKGNDFPMYFDSSYSDSQLDDYIQRFLELRGTLYTGGIVFKKYVDLAKKNGKTNEYRAFYLDDKLITLSQNSNQDRLNNPISKSFVDCVPKLKSRFYTVDFAELENGEWIVIETGDGQVSGLSPNQYIFKFFEEIDLALNHRL